MMLWRFAVAVALTFYFSNTDGLPLLQQRAFRVSKHGAFIYGYSYINQSSFHRLSPTGIIEPNEVEVQFRKRSHNSNRRILQTFPLVFQFFRLVKEGTLLSLARMKKSAKMKFLKHLGILLGFIFAFARVKPCTAASAGLDPSSVNVNSKQENIKYLKRKKAIVDVFIKDSNKVDPELSTTKNMGIEQNFEHRENLNVKEIVKQNSKKFGTMIARVRELPDQLKLLEESLDAVRERAEKEVLKEWQLSWKSLSKSLEGAKLDTLIMLMATGAVIPMARKLAVSPIICFMVLGCLLGPSTLNIIKDIHMIDILGELGIVFFLFEMGLELSLDRLKKMKKDVFGLGTSQFITTTCIGTAMASMAGLAPAAAFTIGGSLSLSSSAFSLQILKDKNAMGTRHGRASFGILLLQDLAVVPLLVIVELLAQGGTGLSRALGIAASKAIVALSAMSFAGKSLLNPIFSQVAETKSQEAFLSIILATVLLMSFVTKGIGLSDTLGAFLAGILLSETSYRHQIETDIAPFRGLLLGFFFMTVGFSIDPKLLFLEGPLILSLLFLLVGTKAILTTSLACVFGVPLASALHTGLLNSSGGEFAFVALTIAESRGVISSKLTKILLTTVALSMAATPYLDSFGSTMSLKMEQSEGYSHFTGGDAAGKEVKEDIEVGDFVLIIGHGRVGKMVCDLLDRKLVKYVVIDNNPQRAFEGRTKDLPVFYGDVNRPDLLRSFKAGQAKAIVMTTNNIQITNKAVRAMKQEFPNTPIIVKAQNSMHRAQLEAFSGQISAICPALPRDSALLTLPFGGAVLQSLGIQKKEIENILEDFRKVYAEGEGHEDSFGFLDFLNPSLGRQKYMQANDETNSAKKINQPQKEVRVVEGERTFFGANNCGADSDISEEALVNASEEDLDIPDLLM